MIRRFGCGVPIDTGAVLQKPALCRDELPFFEKRGGCYYCRMDKDDVVYGLGENVRGLNKRGWHYISDCSDNPHHTEGHTSLYAAHNFFILDGETRFGAFFDYAGKIEFDVGYTHSNELKVAPADENIELYIIDGGSLKAIVKQFRALIGRSYIPPKWAFGCGQSRWGYKDEQDVRSVFTGYKSSGIPLDSIYLDIDYMQDFADFTVNKDRFPDLPQLSAELKESGVRLVPIIDAGVKQLDGDATYEQGKASGYFCKNADGSDFTGAVWPGLVHFPDTLNKEAREWFGGRYKALLDMGVEGFWNDMNEPAIFYTPETFSALCDELAQKRGRNMDLWEFFDLQDKFMRVSNNPADYARMYHNIDGKLVNHTKVHNLYGYNMTRAASEAFARLCPGKRILLFSRASCIGMHRYGGIWFGDNRSWWQHLLLSFQLMANANMCGFLYCGSDIGGFGDDTTEELALRWTAMAVFSPLMRNHCAMGQREQEPYKFDDVTAFRSLIKLRYSLIPYIYSEFVKAALEGDMLLRPLAFDYPRDAFASRVEDQLMFGEGLMLAPVYTQNAKGRYVYLPEEMLCVVMRSPSVFTAEPLAKGHHYIDVGLDEVLFFVKKGCVLPLAAPAMSTRDIKNEFTFISFGGASYTLYDDDGFTTDFEAPEHYTVLKAR